MKRDIPYAIIVPIAMVCFAIVLMISAMSGTSGVRSDDSSRTTTGAATQSTETAVRVPTAPTNDAASDSARTSGPLNKSR